MASDEALREALLELQTLRERETAAHTTTANLLACLEALNSAEDPRTGLRALLQVLVSRLNADQAMLVEGVGGMRTRVTISDGSTPAGAEIVFPFSPFRRQRNLMDLHAAGEWSSDALSFDDLNSVLVAPAGGELTLLVLAQEPAAFAALDSELASKVAPLAAQGWRSAKLVSENALLAATIQGSSSGFAISDARTDEKPLIYVNPAFEELSGYSAAEVLGRNCRFLTAEPENSPERRRLSATVAQNGRGRFLLRNKRKSGEGFWNELTLFPVLNEQDEVTHLVATQTDATVRVQAEEDRDAVRTRMEAALRATEDAFLIVEPDGQIIFANAAMREQFPSDTIGWARGSRFIDNWADYLNALPRAPAEELRVPDFARLAREGARREVSFPDGRSFLMNASRMEDGAFVVFATNITALKVAERVSLQQLAALDAALDGIALVDKSGRILSLNSAAVGLLGFRDQESAMGHKWPRRYVGAEPDMETPAIVARSGEREEERHEISLSPTRYGTVLVIRDVTARLREEDKARSLGEALAVAQRREAVSQITAGLAHDFNNVLSAIMGSASLISMDNNVHEKARGHAARVETAGRSAAKLVNRLLDMGTEAQDHSLFDLRSALTDLPDLLGSNLPGNQRLKIDAGPQALVVEGDMAELSQILLNMVLNARDAMGDSPGQITLSLSSHTPQRTTQEAVGVLEAGQHYALIEIQDEGAGIDADALPKLFDAYFSTKGAKGTGLGLAVAATQIRAMRGAIDVQSTLGEGTIMRLFCPLAELSEAAQQSDDTATDISLAGTTLLVVDDDSGVAEVLSAFLEAQGAEVATCEDPLDAAEALAEDPDSWSALITDYDMPGMNGGELVEHTRTVAPNVPIFVVTALARRTTDPRLRAENIAGLFAKPVDLRKLAEAISEALPGRD
ncbi:PAS domain-containing hybrid sensor histidine kinase/response regulator [Pontivivens insulae]|uniref:histidine kinase n=1 Tax=Pontivivens insulae TaxID=1639689 RepID=A0A2R8A717_9RHOB|nr:PAS domain S-box protein [Pontivivens insulae]RED18075.1 PAS/PAC sensor hybrid histidine kinase [Pontivivens insulae]SPF27972.1 Sensor kinase CckA [Pontivivens insulae]